MISVPGRPGWAAADGGTSYHDGNPAGLVPGDAFEAWEEPQAVSTAAAQTATEQTLSGNPLRTGGIYPGP